MNTITAADLGIEVTGENGLYRWLIASFLMGKRIRSSVAVQAFRLLVDQQGLDTPDKLAACPHSTLVRILGQAGYARYDVSTARRLRALAGTLKTQLGPQLLDLRKRTQDLEGFKRWLLDFEGVGPKTIEIFMREASTELSQLCQGS
ncbi:DNA methylase [Pseudomonas sp. CAM1A]|uniref:DNA methylase n=1 Tax=Pseudomonas sp. CAM1A TaxID=3231717 RepID=UPI0039C664CA